MNIKMLVLIIIGLIIAGLTYYLFRPLAQIPTPATFSCLDLEDGKFIQRDSLPMPKHIYGMGLTYSQHLIETAAEYDPGSIPPIFRKKLQSITGDQATIKLPTVEEMISACGELEKEVADKLKADFDHLSPMLDYEVELGFVLLSAISAADLADENFIPKLGFFIANDLSARSVGLMGEGTEMRYEYWGISKSFPGFLPISDKVWIPNTPSYNSIPCIRIETYVNGQIRQSQTTDNMIYTPLEMLRFIHQKHPNIPLEKGDLVLTGTPGGVAISTPRALVRLSHLLGFDRYKKLSLKLKGDLSGFLKSGDVVAISGEGLGRVSINVTQ